MPARKGCYKGEPPRRACPENLAVAVFARIQTKCNCLSSGESSDAVTGQELLPHAMELMCHETCYLQRIIVHRPAAGRTILIDSRAGLC